MPKFYQHFEPNDNFGKITRLKYIDDVSDDDFVLYVFADGTKCNEDYIGEVTVGDPLSLKCIMVELAAPSYPWRLTKTEFELDKPEPTLGKDGVLYEPVEYAVDVNTGKPKVKEGTVKIDAQPPVLPRRWEVEPREDYLLSLHPELEYGGDRPVQKPVNKPQPTQAPPVQPSQPVYEAPKVEDQPIAQAQESTAGPIVIDLPEPEDAVCVCEDYVELPLPVNTFFNLDVMKLRGAEELTFVNNGKQYSVSMDELADLLDKAEKGLLNEVSYAGDEIIANESPLIKNMIDMAKKRICDLTMDISLELPAKCVYDTIKNSYSDELAEEFVKSLTARISQENLLRALAEGLSAYYEGLELTVASNS